MHWFSSSIDPIAAAASDVGRTMRIGGYLTWFAHSNGNGNGGCYSGYGDGYGMVMVWWLLPMVMIMDMDMYGEGD